MVTSSFLLLTRINFSSPSLTLVRLPSSYSSSALLSSRLVIPSSHLLHFNSLPFYLLLFLLPLQLHSPGYYKPAFPLPFKLSLFHLSHLINFLPSSCRFLCLPLELPYLHIGLSYLPASPHLLQFPPSNSLYINLFSSSFHFLPTPLTATPLLSSFDLSPLPLPLSLTQPRPLSNSQCRRSLLSSLIWSPRLCYPNTTLMTLPLTSFSPRTPLYCLKPSLYLPTRSPSSSLHHLHLTSPRPSFQASPCLHHSPSPPPTYFYILNHTSCPSLSPKLSLSCS